MASASSSSIRLKKYLETEQRPHCTALHFFHVHSASLALGAIMSFARTFLRTSRALRSPSSNPIHNALNAQGQSHFLRSYATVFERTKPHVNIGTIGHVDHGKVRQRPSRSHPRYAQLTMLSGTRPPSPQPSPSVRPKRASQPTSSTAQLTKPPKSASAASPSARHTLNTRPTTDITPTSTARVTRITSRT